MVDAKGVILVLELRVTIFIVQVRARRIRARRDSYDLFDRIGFRKLRYHRLERGSNAALSDTARIALSRAANLSDIVIRIRLELQLIEPDQDARIGRDVTKLAALTKLHRLHARAIIGVVEKGRHELANALEKLVTLRIAQSARIVIEHDKVIVVAVAQCRVANVHNGRRGRLARDCRFARRGLRRRFRSRW